MDTPFNALGLSHRWIEERIRPGDFCIDATAGRGRDTLFLAKTVGDAGKVLAFDIQEEAVRETRKLLAENKIRNATVHLACHSRMGEFAERESVAGIMFNFGWLPGGNHNVFSHESTSIAAIKAGLALLKPKGIMTLCIYYGKETGYEEKDALLAYLKTLDQKQYSVLLHQFINRKNDPPMAVLLVKEA